MKTITSQDLKKAFDSAIDLAAKQIQVFPWENREAYLQWLAQTYYLVRHTTRFLCLSAARAPIDKRELHYGFVKHLGEESNHDIPLINDMKKLGAAPDQYPELPQTRLLRNNQYYWLDNGGVYSLMGYSL